MELPILIAKLKQANLSKGVYIALYAIVVAYMPFKLLSARDDRDGYTWMPHFGS